MNFEDNVTLNEIEVTSGTKFDFSDGLDAENARFLDEFYETCKSYIAPCACRAGLEFIKRAQERAATKAMIAGIRPNTVSIEPDEELFDSYRFNAIIHCKHGMYVDIPLIVKECKTCHRLEFFGSANAVATLLAIEDVNAINNGETIVLPDDGEMTEEELIGALEEGGLSGVELVELESTEEEK